MVTTPFSIPASLIRQHCFCPRIPWYNEVLQLNPGDRPWQRQGVDYHTRLEMLNKRRRLSRYGLDKGTLKHQVSLRHPDVGIHGIADAIIFHDGKLSVLEFKISGSKPTRGQRLQLVAYAIMAENHFSKNCDQGFIVYGERGKTVKIEINQPLRSKTLETIAAIKHNLGKPLLPVSSASSEQCGQCEYFNFCADRE